MMAKRGPKPKDPASALAGDLSPAEIRRITEAAQRSASDPNLGTPYGRLFLTGILTREQMSAATRVSTLRALHDRAAGLPSRNTAAIDYNATRGISLISDQDPARDARIITAYRDLVDALAPHPRAWSAVELVVLDEREPAGWEDRLYLRDGLTLAWVWFENRSRK